METVKLKTAIYPGCSLEGTESAYEKSLVKVLNALGIEYNTLDDWNCCGATSAHALDHSLYLSLAMRNLELAELQGYNEILAPCAACYHRLASANFELQKDANLLKRLNEEAGLNYQGKVKVRNVLDFLANDGYGTRPTQGKSLESHHRSFAKAPDITTVCRYHQRSLGTKKCREKALWDYPVRMNEIRFDLFNCPLEGDEFTEDEKWNKQIIERILLQCRCNAVSQCQFFQRRPKIAKTADV